MRRKGPYGDLSTNMELGLTSRARVKKGGCLGHQILVDDGAKNFLLASQPCSVLTDKCQTIEVDLVTGPGKVSLCGEHFIALKVLQRQSEIDRGPEVTRPKQCFPGKANADTPGALGEFEESLICAVCTVFSQDSNTSHTGSATAVETDTEARAASSASKKKKKKDKKDKKDSAETGPSGAPFSLGTSGPDTKFMVAGTAVSETEAAPDSDTKLEPPRSPPIAVAYSPSGRDIPLLPLATEITDFEGRWLRIMLTAERLRSLGFLPPEGQYPFKGLFVGMATDNPQAALLHLPLLSRFLEIPKAHVILQILGLQVRVIGPVCVCVCV